MEIDLQDIDRRKKELRKEERLKEKLKYKQERKEARDTIIDYLTERDPYYEGVLKLAKEYNIKLPIDILKKATGEYEKSARGDSEALINIQWAYEKLNYKEKARSLEEKIRLTIQYENLPSLE